MRIPVQVAIRSMEYFHEPLIYLNEIVITCPRMFQVEIARWKQPEHVVETTRYYNSLVPFANDFSALGGSVLVHWAWKG